MKLRCLVLSVVVASLFPFSNGLSARRREHAADVDRLREAVNNAFDALTEVHEAVMTLEDNSNDDTDSTYSRDVDMGEIGTEKFVDGIDQLEDMILNKKEVNGFDESKKEAKKDEKESKLMQLPAKRAEVDSLESIDSDQLNDEDIEKSVDFLVDVLKEGLQHQKRESKLREYLKSIFEKETLDAKKGREEIASVDVDEKEIKSAATKAIGETEATPAVKLDANHSVKELRDGDETDTREKESEKKEELRKTAKSDTKSKSLKQEAASDNSKVNTKLKKETASDNSKVNTKLSDNTSGEKTKKFAKIVKGHPHPPTGPEFDIEVRDLVDAILKRKEEFKREKLKSALAEMFKTIESKDEGYKQKKDS